MIQVKAAAKYFTKCIDLFQIFISLKFSLDTCRVSQEKDSKKKIRNTYLSYAKSGASFVVGNSPRLGHYQNEESASGRFQILVMPHLRPFKCVKNWQGTK
jgi:hypothetical protein